MIECDGELLAFWRASLLTRHLRMDASPVRSQFGSMSYVRVGLAAAQFSTHGESRP